ncbi:probable erythromycin esterase [Cephalotrichum gorgonifer]|uniref:Probable erythromycin esterase n=1 Tax=Cephalotrichum gorgonifer TaxID=2041049 RepID=A0AAE8SZS8_9PEZI|nr:probable erythromycin esterase [Cephalotrichum gorgonifer]
MVRSLSAKVRDAAQRLPAIEDKAFGAAFDAFGNHRVVLIGDGSHGTSEFYRARCAITKRLIEQHNFKTIAIEADWPDAHIVDRYVRYYPSKKLSPTLPAFNHFPKWMWRNTEFQEFVNWLRNHNADLPARERTGIAGMDLYSMGASIHAVQDYLRRVNPEIAKLAKQRYSCLEPWMDDPALYGRQAFLSGTSPCEEGVVRMLRDLLERRLELVEDGEDGEDFFNAEMNARLVRDAEAYYRAMFYGSDDSWNKRDTHFFDTLVRLLQHRPLTKAVVWAHNSHVGDARYTGMGEARNELNIGQLCKEEFGDECAIIGCSTHTGTVAAAHEWDDDMQVMEVNPSRGDSYEYVMHETGVPSFKLDLREGQLAEELRRELMVKRLQRFIGVIYRPRTERYSHYSQAVLPKQMDCLVWFDETEALHAFETAQPHEPPSIGETYPFGL